MYCPNCGSKCEESHRFCFHCGSHLPQMAAIDPAKPAAVSPEPHTMKEPDIHEAAEPTPAVLPDAASESPSESGSKQKGRLWPPFVLLTLMAAIGLFVFFLTASHSGKDPNMPWFQVKDGVLYFNAAVYTGGSELTVPETIGGQTVTALSEGCFARCDMLTTVVLPDSLREIGVLAFAQCTSMRGIFIPESVTAIGAEAFYGCTALEAIYIPGTISSIGQQAFLGCGKLHYVFFSGTYLQWTALYTGRIAVDTVIYCADGSYPHLGRS